jgi:hypothetical protein
MLGALAFWLPDVIGHLAWGSAFGGVAVLLITVVMPVATLWAFARVDVAALRTLRGWPRALLMLLGIWSLGPVFMMLSATADGGGFLTFDSTADWLMMFQVPASTFIAATYDGALGALLLTTLLLPLAAAIGSRTKRGKVIHAS